jgi:hypothetical protein
VRRRAGRQTERSGIPSGPGSLASVRARQMIDRCLHAVDRSLDPRGHHRDRRGPTSEPADREKRPSHTSTMDLPTASSTRPSLPPCRVDLRINRTPKVRGLPASAVRRSRRRRRSNVKSGLQPLDACGSLLMGGGCRPVRSWGRRRYCSTRSTSARRAGSTAEMTRRGLTCRSSVDSARHSGASRHYSDRQASRYGGSHA